MDLLCLSITDVDSGIFSVQHHMCSKTNAEKTFLANIQRTMQIGFARTR